MLKSELVALVEVPTTIQGDDGRFKKAVGTAYPIRDGLVLTARHVLYHDNINAEKERIFSWRLSDADEPYHTAVVTQTDIVFEDADFDVAVVRCDTSKLTLPLGILGEIFPDEGDGWKSRGYPRAGVEAGKREQVRAGGEFTATDARDRTLDLRVKDKAAQSVLWKGMSGAPIFHLRTNKLVGVWVRGANLDENNREVFEERLVAASIPYLLHGGKCLAFRQAVLEPDLIANYFQGLANWLGRHPKAKQAIWFVFSKTDATLKDCPVALVNKLKSLPISELFDKIYETQLQSAEPSVKSELASVFKRLLPAFYETGCMVDLCARKGAAGLVVGIPFATPVSAEILMAATDQREVDFVFHPVSKRNSRLVAYPGKYRLALPPESGSVSAADVEAMMSDDLIRRFGLDDLNMNGIGIAIDNYLYDNLAPRRRTDPTREQKCEAVQRELKRLASDVEQGSYYWFFVAEENAKFSQHWNQVALRIGNQYPEITCLSLEGGYDQELDEEDLFANLYKILKPDVV